MYPSAVVRALRLTERQWRVYLAVWLGAVAILVGMLGGLTVPRLFVRQPPPRLGGGLVMGPGQIAAPDFALTDQHDATVSLASLRGEVVALTFLDTKCTNLCPLQARVLGNAESDLGSREPFVVVVVSVRPEADTATTVASFAAANGLRSYRWLSGPKDRLQAVWNEYGIAVQVANGDLEHSSVIYLIDRSGFERVGFLDVPDASAFDDDVRILASTA